LNAFLASALVRDGMMEEAVVENQGEGDGKER
jgi:hypothetical protein